MCVWGGGGGGGYVNLVPRLLRAAYQTTYHRCSLLDQPRFQARENLENEVASFLKLP